MILVALIKCSPKVRFYTHNLFHSNDPLFYLVGFDLYSAEERVVIPANKNGVVKTDIAVHLPLGSYGRVAPRYEPLDRKTTVFII